MAALSLLALVAAIVLGSATRINLGILALVTSAGIAAVSKNILLSDVMKSFPIDLFITLVGVTALFATAQRNGTLERITSRLVALSGNRPALVPLIFFALSTLLSSIGAGNIAAAALLAPSSMTAALELGISPFLMAVMVANGANAGALSPLAPTGLIAADRMSQAGISGLEGTLFVNSLAAHGVVAFLGYLLFGGVRLWKKSRESPETKRPISSLKFEIQHRLTLLILALLLTGVMTFDLDIGMGALTGAILLGIMKAGDETKALSDVPWNILLLVCGMSTLTAVIESVGGLDLVTQGLVKISTVETIVATFGFAAALISVYSSSSGVVLPTFLAMIPKIVSNLPGSRPEALAASVAISSHLVDVSPLSTIGAICISAVPSSVDRVRLFNQMLAWGLAMTLFGAGVSYLLFGWIGL